jgi:hypothetical protein
MTPQHSLSSYCDRICAEPVVAQGVDQLTLSICDLHSIPTSFALS